MHAYTIITIIFQVNYFILSFIFSNYLLLFICFDLQVIFLFYIFLQLQEELNKVTSVLPKQKRKSLIKDSKTVETMETEPTPDAFELENNLITNASPPLDEVQQEPDLKITERRSEIEMSPGKSSLKTSNEDLELKNPTDKPQLRLSKSKSNKVKKGKIKRIRFRVSDTENREGKVIYKCDKCDFVSHYQFNLKRHMSKTHLKLKIYSCPDQDCSFKTQNKRILLVHSKSHKKNKNPQFNCSLCDFVSEKKKEFLFHKEIHPSLKVKNCSKCSYKATSNYVLKVHEKLHLKNDVIECSKCSFKILDEKEMEEHIKIAHKPMPVQEKCYDCNICGFSSLNLVGLMKHKAMQHQ